MDDSELINIFWTEVRDYLERMNNLLMALETSTAGEDAGNFVERLRELNRLAHSMKGAARSVGEPGVGLLGHHMEEILEASLKRGLALTPEVCDLLYDALDLVATRAEGNEIPADALEEVVERMEAVVREERLAGADVVYVPGETPRKKGANGTNIEEFTALRPEDMTPPTPDTDVTQPVPAVPATPTNQTMTTLMRPTDDTVRVSVEKLDKLMAEASELLVTRLQNEERRSELDALRRRYARWVKEWRAVRAAYVRLARRLQTETASEDLRTLFEFLEGNQKHLLDTIRAVNTLAGHVANDTTRLGTLADEIQSSIGALRLVPFDTILSGLQRSLRDAARETEKEVYLDVVGGGTEIDKTVLEHLKDPIMHLIRNAVDHGIEDAATRTAKGKPPAGWVYITIETRGSEIVIHVSDDGRGVDADVVRAAAVERGVVTAAVAGNMTDEEARALIFHPGLTTRREVTAISGRGVGMDVVRTRVEGLRGRVSLSSVPGHGTTITMSVPVSLTRIRSVLLRVGGERYAVPALSVGRMERLPTDATFDAEGRTVVNMGAVTLPLVSLAGMLGTPGSAPADDLRVIVLNAGERSVAFAVDELESEQELVLKPLGEELANTRHVSGAALLGGGEVVIVLDANDLVRGAIGEAYTTGRLPQQPPAEGPEPEQTRLRVLIVDDSITTRTLEKNILETAGCDVQSAFDGVQAWETLTEHDFDVVISDVEMPRMDGLELTRRIKSYPATRHIPVILLTSLQKPEHREAGLEAGADAYLVKSRFDQADLLRTIQSVL